MQDNRSQSCFLPVLNKEQLCACAYAGIVGKQVVEKLSYFGTIYFTKHLCNTKQTLVVY